MTKSSLLLPPKIRVGILGGGQLARMLALSGHAMGLEMHVLSESPLDPAAQTTHHWHQGVPTKSSDVLNFLSKIDVATFESEFMDAALLQNASLTSKTPIYPEPQLMGVIQDRLTQKQLLIEHKIPTADFIEVSNQAQAEQALNQFKNGMVLKKRRFGYDGYGTFFVRQKKDLLPVLNSLESDPNGFIAEELIQYKKELALLLARNQKGQIVNFPTVETHQQNGRCLWVKGPLQKKIPSNLLNKLKNLLKKSNYQGVMAFEMFDTGKSILINELAPRVHNSCHYSQNALNQSQFDVHLRCLIDAPLYPVQTLSKGFAMLNLLGTSEQAPQLKYPQDIFVHWYGKSANRLHRKMGHLNALDTSADKALKKLIKKRKDIFV